MNKTLALLIIIFPGFLWATPQNGLGFELGVGYSNFSLRDQTQNAKYSGVSVQGNLLFPILTAGQFSIDLDFAYKYTSLENNANTSTQSEWSHQTVWGSGLRFNYSYLFAGFDYQFGKGKHLMTGTTNNSFEYDYNPLHWHAGIALPLSPVTSVVVGYSNIIQTDFELAGAEFSANEEAFWLRLQIDFGVSFLNLLAPSESFTPTRNNFFVN